MIGLKANAHQLRDWLTGGLVVGLGVALFLASNAVKDFASVGVGSAFLPRLVAFVLLLSGLVILSQGLRRNTPTQSSSEEESTVESDTPKVFGGLPGVALTVALMLAYLILLDTLGFLIASAAYVFLQILVLSKDAPRRLLSFALSAVIPALLAYFLFVNVFQISLPVGFLG